MAVTFNALLNCLRPRTGSSQLLLLKSAKFYFAYSQRNEKHHDKTEQNVPIPFLRRAETHGNHESRDSQSNKKKKGKL